MIGDFFSGSEVWDIYLRAGDEEIEHVDFHGCSQISKSPSLNWVFQTSPKQKFWKIKFETKKEKLGLLF